MAYDCYTEYIQFREPITYTNPQECFPVSTARTRPEAPLSSYMQQHHNLLISVFQRHQQESDSDSHKPITQLVQVLGYSSLDEFRDKFASELRDDETLRQLHPPELPRKLTI